MIRIIAVISFFVLSLIACTGDCLTCHPKLVPTIDSDERHKPMLTCIECHSPEPNSMAECGDDCFGCHSISKIESAGVAEHMVIRECRDCHVEKANEIMRALNYDSQSKRDSIRELLLD